MAVPTTNVSFSAISLELGGNSTAEFSLSNGSMRSLLSTGPATPGAPISVSSVNNSVLTTFTISSNTADYNIYNALVALGWNPLVTGSRVNANLDITSPGPTVNTVVYGTTPTGAGIDTGLVPSTANLKITLATSKVYVTGMGGAGGDGGPGDSTGGAGAIAGTPGGDAIKIRGGTSPVTIVNNGTIGGGGGGGGGGRGVFTPCLAGDTEILLADNTTKQIRDIVPGDKLKTLTGEVGTVIKLSPTKLQKHRKFLKLYSTPNSKPLRITDDHELWIKDGFIESFGVYNYNGWLEHELLAPSYNSGDRLYPMKPLLPNEEYTFATVDGWVTTKCEWETNSDPEEDVYCILMNTGVGFIADGFVVANDDFFEDELKGISWRGV